MAGPTCSTPVATPPQGTAAPPVTSGAGPLRHLTEPLEEAEADHRAGEDEEGEVNVVAPLVADHQPAAAGDPGQGALHQPPVPAQPLAALDPAPGDARDDAALPAGTAAAAVVVGLVGVQLLRAPSRPAARLAHRRHGVERLLEHGAVVRVRGGEQDRQRDALPVHDEVALGARLAAVGRVRPVAAPPALAGTLALSSEHRLQSIRPA